MVNLLYRYFLARPVTSMLAFTTYVKSKFFQLLGYHKFNWILFTDLARWAISWSNYVANQRGSDLIDVKDLKMGLILAESNNEFPHDHVKILPFSEDARVILMDAWALKNKSGDRYFYASHLHNAIEWDLLRATFPCLESHKPK
jgi:hypothetical protein